MVVVPVEWVWWFEAEEEAIETYSNLMLKCSQHNRNERESICARANSSSVF